MINRMPLTRGRRLALIIGVPLALVVIGWTGVSEVAFAGIGSYRVHLDVPVHGPSVQLGLGSANASVTQAAGDRLRLSGKATYSIVRSTVTWRSTPSGAVVSTQCHFLTGVCAFDFQAVLPAGRPASVADGSGDITLRGLSGRLSASDGSGNIRGSGLTGPVNFQDGSGDIAVGGLASTEVTASDQSGNITLTFTKVPDRVNVSNGSGDVRLVLPRGRTLYRVNATASSGDLVVGVLHSSVSRHVITVTDGSGNVSITY
jgi:Putative adhesin